MSHPPPHQLLRGPVAVAVAAVLLAGCSGGSDPVGTTPPTSRTAGSTTSPDAVPTSASTSTAPAGPPPVTASAVGTATLPPVPVAADAPFGDGLVATVSRIEEVQLAATGPGEVAGPGVAVHLSLRNGTTGGVDLGGVVVTASSDGGVPADQSTAAPSSIPTGVLGPNATVEGVWVFSAAAGAAASLQVTIGSLSSGNVVVVSG